MARNSPRDDTAEAAASPTETPATALPAADSTEEENPGDQPAPVLLCMEDVTKAYAPSTGGREVTILKHVNLAMNEGDAVAVLAPSGSGKTSLLALAAGLERPTWGTIEVAGTNLLDLHGNELCRWRAANIGVLLERTCLVPQCNVLENVLVPTFALKKRPRSMELYERATEFFELLCLDDRVPARTEELGRGEIQRVALARALINCPKLLVADEPTGQLDRSSGERFLVMLRELARHVKCGVLLATHSETVAHTMDRVLSLRDGEVR